MRLLPRSRRKGDGPGFFARFHQRFEHGFERFRDRYVGVITSAIDRPIATLVVMALVLATGGGLLMFVGQDFFPPISSSTHSRQGPRQHRPAGDQLQSRFQRWLLRRLQRWPDPHFA